MEMDIQQVQVDIMGRRFNIGTPSSEYDTLMQAVQMLNDKIDVIQQSGRIVEIRPNQLRCRQSRHDRFHQNLGAGRRTQ